MKKGCFSLSLILLLGASAFADNIALNKEVFLSGTFFTGGWGGGAFANASTITDGNFFPQSQQWDQGPVWWDANYLQADTNSIYIDLDGDYEIESFIVQVDDNDAYILEYHDINSNTWQLAWDVPNYNVYMGTDLWGMQTRPDPTNNSMQYFLSAPIFADQLRIKGNLSNSDWNFSVSEVQAFGHAVPEPSSMSMLLLGVFTLLGVGLRRKKR
jgi:hypothetical protein